ncbi:MULTISPECIES: helix-turn-helix domain-containing protein [Sphingobium]|mgnify:CR=1 FL=1|uniref:XRE family transcriptional regulator n=1 Tax=Sphingobium yanoikuyae TaxID=13690 RepID=A0A177JUE6_SPHYA|nr:helix-turn-helix transcriptional regulator [Sphingobium yanoikuyae]OAH43955.1 XRE family transcriptional regulator [Sphingobium yanoikuyae]PZU67034.1 MAG: XRE family transcriptional regulator [Sphingobium sp.]
MTVQIVEIAGQKIAMLPVEDYQRLVDVAEDKADMVAAAEAARRRDEGEEYVPAVVVDRIMAGDSPLRAWRKYRGLTLEQLALRVPMTAAYLSDLERVKREGSVGTWMKLARALGVAIDDITIES